MRRALTFTNEALADVREVRRWLTQPGAGARARRRLAQINTAIGELVATPCSWPKGDIPGSRERPVEGYRLVNKIEPDTGRNESAGDVTVLRVFGPGQDRAAV